MVFRQFKTDNINLNFLFLVWLGKTVALLVIIHYQHISKFNPNIIIFNNARSFLSKYYFGEFFIIISLCLPFCVLVKIILFPKRIVFYKLEILFFIWTWNTASAVVAKSLTLSKEVRYLLDAVAVITPETHKKWQSAQSIITWKKIQI